MTSSPVLVRLTFSLTFDFVLFGFCMDGVHQTFSFLRSKETKLSNFVTYIPKIVLILVNLFFCV